MDKEITYYLAGPMTGIPHFNFPAFQEATKSLRAQGYNIISPVELDRPELAAAALASETGSISDLPKTETWGEILARDVRIIADECDGVMLLPYWYNSKGATLEAVVGLLCGHTFNIWANKHAIPLPFEYIIDNVDLVKAHLIDFQGGPKIMRGNNEHIERS